MRQVICLACARDDALDEPVDQPGHQDDEKDLNPGNQDFKPVLHPIGQAHLKTTHNQSLEKNGRGQPRRADRTMRQS
ncbi:hypothetical protein SDC9_179483 [bioreactor metagenome]|uniref:Uncharacterized protein n=1 Tax=bioreactor metagenome TaxID=1076179 RepID=A0A645GZ42_9ZZZZ